MKPEHIGNNYDQIASWWLDQMRDSRYGLSALTHALKFVEKKETALDVGCGAEGRFLRVLLEHGFRCNALDISSKMIALASERFPEVKFSAADICSWELPQKFDFISAWDSIFHLPLEWHEPVLRKLCDGLNKDGVLLFSAGGGDKPGEVHGEFGGCTFAYSTLGVPAFIKCLMQCGCSVKHLEYDQLPENHIFIVAKKVE